MTLDKSLYMYSFHKERDLLGTVEYTKVIDPLYDNLYSAFESTKKVKVVQEVVEDIQDKIIDLSKEDKHILFPDVGDLEDVEELTKELPKPEDPVSMSREESVEAEIDEIVSSIKSEEDLEIKVENSTSNSSTEDFVLDQIKD